MSPSIHQAARPEDEDQFLASVRSLLRPKTVQAATISHRSLLVMACLAGMACAAGTVLLIALRPPARRDTSLYMSASAGAQGGKLSALGPALAAPAPAEVKLTTQELAIKASRAVVSVSSYDGDEHPITQANGYVYLSSGIVVTTYDAIRGARSVAIKTAAGGELHFVSVRGFSEVRDLAALAVAESGLTALESEVGDAVKAGDLSFAVGPGGELVEGSVGAPGNRIPFRSATNASAASGSPVLNEYGRVVGMLFAKTLATPCRYIEQMLTEQRSLTLAQLADEVGENATRASSK